ncbi:unnamed protein product, partial [Onchocerca ochengi]
FVQNRVEEIWEAKLLFRYVPSEHNPVDIATKGISPRKLGKYDLWYESLWLRENESSWRQWEFNFKEKIEEPEEKTIAKITTHINANFKLINGSRFSKWLKLLRTTLRVQVHQNNVKRKIQMVTTINS